MEYEGNGTGAMTGISKFMVLRLLEKRIQTFLRMAPRQNFPQGSYHHQAKRNQSFPPRQGFSEISLPSRKAAVRNYAMVQDVCVQAHF